LGQADQRCSHT